MSLSMASAQVWGTISNQYVRVEVGTSGQENGLNIAGRFRITDLKTGNVILAGPSTGRVGTSQTAAIPGSFVTIRIDGGAPPATTTGTVPGWDIVWGDNVNTTGQWIQQPTVVSGKLFASWSTLVGATATNPIPPVQVDCEVSLIHKMVAIKFTVYNGIPSTAPPTPGSQSHSIGLRFAQNFEPDSAGKRTEGPVVPSVGPEIGTDTTFSGSQVGTGYKVYDSSDDVSVGGLFLPNGAEPTFLPPDQVIYSASSLMSETWDHTPITIPGFNFATDSWDAAAALYWNPRVFPAGGTPVSFTAYYGLQNPTIDVGRPWFAGVDAPRHVAFDPSQPAGKQLTPSPLQVDAFVVNYNQLSLTNITAVLGLPKGLKLATTTTQSLTQSLSTLSPASEGLFSWSVVPTGEASGLLTYSVSFSASPGSQGKVITRQIEVPALPTQTFLAGLQLAGFPYTFANPDPSAALGLNVTDFDLLRWNTVTAAYEVVQRIVPGEAYWMRLASGKSITLQGASPLALTNDNFEIRLNRGWAQISSPYITRTRWADARIVSTDSADPDYLTPVTIAEAASRGWVVPTLFWFDNNVQAYRYDLDDTTVMQPFQGYWVHVLKNGLSLLLPKPTGRAVSVTTRSAGTGITNGWQIRLVASSGKSVDDYNFIGISGNSKDTVDTADIEKPPMAINGASVAVIHNDWNARSGSYSRDIRSASPGIKSWNIVLNAPSANSDVTLSWPDITKTSRSYELFVTDVATGERKLMRQQAGMKVHFGDTLSRAYIITAEPRSRAALTINGSITSTGSSRAVGVTQLISTVSQTASVSIKIMGASGNVVRSLVSGRAASAGNSSTLTWDNKDSKGVSVPAGTYNVEFRAVTPDGQVARQVIPITIVR